MLVKEHPSSPRYCVFDYDDTLMMTRECKTQALIALAKRHFDRKITVKQIDEHWGIAHHLLFENLLGVSGEALKNAMRLYEDLDQEFPLVPHQETKEALERIQKEYTLVIVSSCTRKLISTQISNSNISTVPFDNIFGAEETSHHKPSGKVFNCLFETYAHTDLSNFIYVGDGVKDMQAAGEAGLSFFGIDRSDKETTLMKAGNAKVYSSLLDIADEILLYIHNR